MRREDLLGGLAGRLAAIPRPHPVRVAIDGVDAAGKTTFADELAPLLAPFGRSVIRVSIDDFIFPRAIRYRRGSDSGESYYQDSFDYAAFEDFVLKPLGPGGSLRYRRAAYSLELDAAVESPVLEAVPESMLLVDGVFLLRPELRDFWDFSIFLDVDFAFSLNRGLERDLSRFGSVQATRERYERRYIPGQKLYLEQARPRDFAGVVVDNNDPARPKFIR